MTLEFPVTIIVVLARAYISYSPFHWVGALEHGIGFVLKRGSKAKVAHIGQVWVCVTMCDKIRKGSLSEKQGVLVYKLNTVRATV